MAERPIATFPLVEEELTVRRREVETGRVRVRTRTLEEEVVAEDTLTREEVSVERHAIGRVVDEVPPVREEGPILIIPVVEERIVSERRLVLVEEIRLVRETRTEREGRPVRLLKQVVDIERLPPTTTGDEQ